MEATPELRGRLCPRCTTRSGHKISTTSSYGNIVLRVDACGCVQGGLMISGEHGMPAALNLLSPHFGQNLARPFDANNLINMR